MRMVSWNKLIEELLDDEKDTDVIIHSTLTDNRMNAEFDGSYGGSCGEPFTAWSNDWVYFPVVYDGAEWVGRVPRDPCDIASNHVGGQ